jgi:hypothetical protein
MPMPEATIHEHRDLLAWKNEIWLAEYRNVPPPPGDAMLPKQRDHSQFSVSISARADTRHDLGSFRRCKNVGHWGELAPHRIFAMPRERFLGSSE